jgi:hypothetical protein
VARIQGEVPNFLPNHSLYTYKGYFGNRKMATFIKQKPRTITYFKAQNGMNVGRSKAQVLGFRVALEGR